jgi:hypothetical protein
MVRLPVSTICANDVLDPLPELELDELADDPPRLPTVADPAPPDADDVPDPDPDPDPELELDDAVPELPADTESPGESPARETIVPLTGAYRLVLVSACWAVCRLASAW